MGDFNYMNLFIFNTKSHHLTPACVFTIAIIECHISTNRTDINTHGNIFMRDTLNFEAAINRADLICPSIAKLLHNWYGSTPVEDILVAEIDPAFAGGSDFCRQYNIPTTEGANCVIVESKRGDVSTIAACLAPVDYKIDFNGVVRKELNGRRVSLAPLDKVLNETSMEYGSVTPVGLPTGWPILIDERIISLPRVIVGAGLVRAKLSLPGKALLELPNVKIIKDLAISMQ